MAQHLSAHGTADRPVTPPQATTDPMTSCHLGHTQCFRARNHAARYIQEQFIGAGTGQASPSGNATEHNPEDSRPRVLLALERTITVQSACN